MIKNVLKDSIKQTMTIMAICGLTLLSIQAVHVASAVDATFDVYLTVDSEISINGTTVGTTTLGNVTLLPNISLTNSVASNTQDNIQIETTDADGYTLTLHATSSPAMQHNTTAATIANHNNNLTHGEWDTSNATEFGFSVFSSSGTSATDIPNAYDDPDANGAATACLGLASNTAPDFAATGANGGQLAFTAAPLEASRITIAQSSGATSGPTDIDLCFFVEAENDSPDAGSYTASIVLRATAN